jgi:hypothetical protein
MERVVRVVLGAGVALWALSRFLDGGVLGWRLAYAAVIALGLDFVVTGVRGYCPLYRRLGWSTARPDPRD